MYDVGIDTAVSYLNAMNVNPDHINADGPGLALGTSGLTPLEMAACFATIANMGEYLQPISFTKITDNQGNVILDMVAEQESKQVYKPSSAYQVIDMLYSALNGGGSAQGALMDGQTVCGKQVLTAITEAYISQDSQDTMSARYGLAAMLTSL